MPNHYTIRRTWTDKAGGFWSWAVTLNGGKRPVCIARTFNRASEYVTRKLKRQAELRAEQIRRRDARVEAQSKDGIGDY